ncbi:MAG: hypothetical protein FD183_873, partial [Chitinophagaceae bacterium]
MKKLFLSSSVLLFAALTIAQQRPTPQTPMPGTPGTPTTNGIPNLGGFGANLGAQRQ